MGLGFIPKTQTQILLGVNVWSPYWTNLNNQIFLTSFYPKFSFPVIFSVKYLDEYKKHNPA